MMVWVVGNGDGNIQVGVFGKLLYVVVLVCKNVEVGRDSLDIEMGYFLVFYVFGY